MRKILQQNLETNRLNGDKEEEQCLIIKLMYILW
jgi:hypothetical protein